MAQQTRVRRVSVILTLLLLVGLAAGCGGTKPEPAKTSPPAAQGRPRFCRPNLVNGSLTE